jgi:hypothetical protein
MLGNLFHSRVAMLLNAHSTPQEAWSYLSCEFCPTDCAVMVSPEEIRFRVWKSFGAPQSPLDIEWRVDLESDDNTEWDGLTISRVPGCVQSAFEKSIRKFK